MNIAANATKELDDSSATREKNTVITRAAVEAAGGALLYSKGALPFVPLAAV